LIKATNLNKRVNMDTLKTKNAKSNSRCIKFCFNTLSHLQQGTCTVYSLIKRFLLSVNW